ncbi:MAG: radical SAM/SPASM domain-containing protein, partial [Bdellovibrionota bacterium]
VCNFRCSFCFQADTEGMKAVGLDRGFMPFELFAKIVDGILAFGRPIKKIKIGNHGEPTLHPELPRMIAYARKQNVAEIVELFTNGSKLGEGLNRQLVDAGLQRINVSLEGLSDDRYFQVAGVRVQFGEIVKSVKHLHGIKKQLQMYVKIADQTHALNKDSKETFTLSGEERKFFFDTFSSIADEVFIEKVVPQWAETQYEKQNTVAETGMYDQKIKKYKANCPFIFMYLHFNCDGTVSPCTLDWPRKVVIGNANTQSVKEIWEGMMLRKLQIAQLKGQRDKINFCGSCSAPMVCVNDDLDPHVERVLSAMKVTPEELHGPNPWLPGPPAAARTSPSGA